ncbi:MAG: zinc ribbon domain-containing protein [Oscillospiraceae bacterium]|nr:zinc ribbon domain-containing protein [Oscillospiraceae bacterium]
MKLFEDLMEASAKFADKATKVATEAFEQTKVVAGEAMDKGKKKVNELELKNEMSKAQKQLGELYYVMRKTGEMNEELLTQYFNNVAAIEAKLEALETEEVNEEMDFTVEEEIVVTPDVSFEEKVEETLDTVEDAVENVVEEVKEIFDGEKDEIELALKVCPSCGAPADDEDLFCSECGSKIGE